MSEQTNTISLTLRIPAGRLQLDIMQKAHQFAEQHGLEVYLTTLQNLRLNNVPETAAEEIREEFSKLGVVFKKKGLFSLPRVCVGAPHCNLGLIDTAKLSKAIMDRFESRDFTKDKCKISIAGCTIGCSGTRSSDIAIEATRNGYNMYAGGKDGIAPKAGRRIQKNLTEEQVLDVIETLIDFHDKKTGKKQRMFKLLDDPEFPYAKV